MDIITPKIDQALEKFRQRKSPSSEISVTASDVDTSTGLSVSYTSTGLSVSDTSFGLFDSDNSTGLCK